MFAMAIEEWTIIFLRGGGWAIFLGTFFLGVTATTTQTINLHTAARHFQGRLSIWTNLYKKCLQKKQQFKKLQKLAG